VAILAISADRRSAAIADRGRLIAAVDAAEATVVDGPAALRETAVDVVLRQAAIRPQDLSDVAVVSQPGAAVTPDLPGLSKGARTFGVPPWRAQLAQAAGAAGDPALLVVVEDSAVPEVFLGRLRDGMLVETASSPGLRVVLDLQRSMAAALGFSGSESGRRLEHLAGEGEPEYQARLSAALCLDGPSPGVDEAEVASIVGDVERRCPGRLRDTDSLHRGVQQARSALAASVRALIVQTFAATIERSSGAGQLAERVGAAGSFFLNPTLNRGLAKAIGRPIDVAPVPEAAGRVLGAALSAGGAIERVRHVALGPAFGEQEIKRVLENCRLEYLYEPEWTRLIARASGLLGSGKLVGWFQEPLDFGPRSLGSRSILCDPSNRYARENINAYLFQRGLDETLGVSIRSELAKDCLIEPVDSPFMLLGGEVRAEFQSSLAAATNGNRECAVHTVDESGHSGLRELLQAHHAATGVPGLINVGLYDSAGALARGPRDAVRSVFGSAVDVLIIGRFIVSKDYWLLRSGRGPTT
jgi:carbamoyltransferase